MTVIVTMQDLRACQVCVSGAKVFAARHGINWGDFLRHGVAAETLTATGDAMALRAVEVANGRQ